MKKSLAVIAGLALAGVAQSFAATQATVALNNYAGGVINYKATPTSTEVALPADAWVEVMGGGTGGAMTSLGTFHPSEPGYFDNGVVLVPGATAGTPASFEVRAWTGAATYDAAAVKNSVSFSSATGSWDDAATPPPVKQGPDLAMPTFTVGAAIPEPSTIALGILGAAALLIRRRK